MAAAVVVVCVRVCVCGVGGWYVCVCVWGGGVVTSSHRGVGYSRYNTLAWQITGVRQSEYINNGEEKELDTQHSAVHRPFLDWYVAVQGRGEVACMLTCRAGVCRACAHHRGHACVIFGVCFLVYSSHKRQFDVTFRCNAYGKCPCTERTGMRCRPTRRDSSKKALLRCESEKDLAV